MAIAGKEPFSLTRIMLLTWSCCQNGHTSIVPNHVHLIAVPETQEGLARAIGEAHRRYTRLINFREGWRGHLWQERFASFPMDESYLLAAARYVEMNPVASGLVNKLIVILSPELARNSELIQEVAMIMENGLTV